MSEAQLGFRSPEVRRLRGLIARRRDREAARAFVVEGTKLVEEALASGAPLEAVFAGPGTPRRLLDRARHLGVPTHTLAPGVPERVASTVTPQPVLAVVRAVDVDLGQVTDPGLAVVGIGIADPGNAGTLLRTAEASGAHVVVLCGASVDVYNPKTVRASAGSIFHVPVVAGGGPAEVLGRLGELGLRRLGAVARGGTDYAVVDMAGPTALLLGNEASGLPPEVAELVDEFVTIPMAGRSESLNVGMAAAVLCFEAARQRRAGR